MFEFSIAKSYLWPKKRHLTVSLIGFLSIFVISIVIWLLLLFLSITEGIEKTWLSKLTSLHAPIRITPKEEYYRSYYYQIDTISALSHYTPKTIGEKRAASQADPYQPEVDEEIPIYWPPPVYDKAGHSLDLVRSVFSTLEKEKEEFPSLSFSDYEVTGALARLRLVRHKGSGNFKECEQSFITQASYVASFAENNPHMPNLLQKPLLKDINNLLTAAELGEEETKEDTKDYPHFSVSLPQKKTSLLSAIFHNFIVEEVSLLPLQWEMPLHFLPEDTSFVAFAPKDRLISHFILPSKTEAKTPYSCQKGLLKRVGSEITFTTASTTYTFTDRIPIYLAEEILAKAALAKQNLDHLASLSEVQLNLSFSLQHEDLQGAARAKNLSIHKGEAKYQFTKKPAIAPPWAYIVGNELILPENGIILPKNFRDNQLLFGDGGYLSFNSPGGSFVQEERVPIHVAGFYDPGIMAMGARFLLAPKEIVSLIHASTKQTALDPLLQNGIQVWCKDVKKTREIAEKLKEAFEKENLSAYWQITPFYEYDFARDLLGQFQNDKVLFMLIGIIILMVACCNIISLLLLLVNDKKQEIGIIISLGASKRSIAMIFGLCGGFMGWLSCLIGIGFALLTLKNIDTLVGFLSMINGRAAFNTLFYGDSLPRDLSMTALFFVLIVTPILSVLAGLVPAIKACRLKPSAILRSE
jgi:lipoprotein-releasing system permease protein